MRDLVFDDMHLFARVAELGTLSAVARERGVPVSQVSRTLSRIERACSARLVHRSTHGLLLTAEGETFLDYCHRVGGTFSELEAEFARKTRDIGGVVRLAVSPSMAHYMIVPSLAGLTERYPRLQVDIHADDRLVDMAREGVDIAIRTGSTHTEAVIAREIGHHSRYLYASPQYLQRHGTPSHPDELAEHKLITNSAALHLNRWPFLLDGEPVARQMQGHYRTASTGIMMSMVLNHLGICRCNDLIAAPLVAEGRLVRLLESHTDAKHFPIYAMMQPQRHRLPKIKACIDYWADWFGSIQPSS
ncbi:LysR family transcriptional regulator [Variovorax terrae]|uniref:LysR family transcriptional regulator n=1 Tax=Variovorax terrae TaxID=2923278 RepID=A0A9X1VY65_9BURK|nr:LysR family transcriptional regulator [Variovorax terrae]MCJ0766061.1 LysR family transcriptional regulator [Variovorax terrae]